MNRGGCEITNPIQLSSFVLMVTPFDLVVVVIVVVTVTIIIITVQVVSYLLIKSLKNKTKNFFR